MSALEAKPLFLPLQYIKFSEVVKIENNMLKNFDIFHIFAQNIDCGYTF